MVLRADRPNIAPVNDPIGAVVWGMDTSNVEWVFVGGTALIEHGQSTKDVARARTLAAAAQRHVTAGARRADVGAGRT
jgi:5-methylthioadenosine/S-adenosylhomocysteine deaminase